MDVAQNVASRWRYPRSGGWEVGDARSSVLKCWLLHPSRHDMVAMMVAVFAGMAAMMVAVFAGMARHGRSLAARGDSLSERRASESDKDGSGCWQVLIWATAAADDERAVSGPVHSARNSHIDKCQCRKKGADGVEPSA